MERNFIVTKESRLYKDIQNNKEIAEIRKKQIYDFIKLNDEKTESSWILGNRFVSELHRYCVDNKITLNIPRVDIGYYFKNINDSTINYSTFPCEEGYCLYVNHDYLKEDDVPQGFIVIDSIEYINRLDKFIAEN